MGGNLFFPFKTFSSKEHPLPESYIWQNSWGSPELFSSNRCLKQLDVWEHERKANILFQSREGGITQLHITAGCHYPNYAVAPKSAYPNTSERSYVSTLSLATWFWTETSKAMVLIRASLPAVMWRQQPLAGWKLCHLLLQSHFQPKYVT